MKVVRSVILLVALALGLAPSARSNELTEIPGVFPVTIGGKTYRLEGLIVKQSDAKGRLPIALFTNGGEATATAAMGAATTTATYAPFARDLARRGWLAVVALRRGFGTSDGPKPGPVGCQADSFNAWVNAAADDLQATINFVAQRPDADASKVIVIGSMDAGVAAVALSARNPAGLVGVFNIAGTLQSESKCPMQDTLLDAFREFGAKSRVPNIWIYSQDDRLSDPDFTDRIHSAFLDGGGDVKFVMFFRNGNVGPAIFGRAKQAWYAQMDGFLALNDLPTWNVTDIEEIIGDLKITNGIEREYTGYDLDRYFADPGEKALAFSPATHKAWVAPPNAVVSLPHLPIWAATGASTLDAARKSALLNCQKTAQDCTIVMENFRWVGGSR